MLIHRYWTGPTSPPVPALTLSDFDIPLSITHWLDERAEVANDRPYHHRANLVRWWLLYEHGGVWMDCDIPEPILFPEYPFALFSRNPDRFRVGVMGFPPHHLIPTLALQYLDTYPFHVGRATSIGTSGSVLLRDLIESTGTHMNRFVL